MSNPQNLYFMKIQKTLNEDFKDFKPLLHLSKKINISLANLILGTLVLILVMMMIGIFSDKLMYFLGFCYPFYKSIVLLKKKPTKFKFDVNFKSENPTKFWLIYWVLFMGLTELNPLIGIFIPLPARLLNVIIAMILISLYHPRSNLIQIIHMKIKPHAYKIKICEEKIFKFLNELKK